MTFTFHIIETSLYEVMKLTNPEHTQTHYCPCRSINRKLKKLKLLKKTPGTAVSSRVAEITTKKLKCVYIHRHFSLRQCCLMLFPVSLLANLQPFLCVPCNKLLWSIRTSRARGLIQASNNHCRNKAHLVQYNILANSSLTKYLWRTDYLFNKHNNLKNLETADMITDLFQRQRYTVVTSSRKLGKTNAVFVTDLPWNGNSPICFHP